MATSKVTSATTVAPTEKRSTMKLDTIREIEKQMQKQWDDLKIFEVDAPGHASDK
jgi:leucyl-tRNA synthetase